ncbi:MAG: class I tRNA ligase family protein, partial [Cyanobacteria bacterium]|nr:class I tRNA ligase family protein [Cyanobacteriota bacterium]
GSDQHRGWFQSSLLTSVMLTHQAPFKSVLTHGFVLDEHGRKMSKSLGNVVDPHTIIQQYGADVLRLWVASVDYTNDVRIGAEIVSHLAEVYKKVRNTVRYMMGNLYDFDPQTDGVPYEDLSLLDQYILSRLAHVVSEITQAFDVYEFHRYYQVLQNFCVVDLSSHYFDPVKDILYTYPKKGTVRRGVQTVLYEILMTLISLLVPVMPHLADDIWMNLPENQKTQLPDSETPLDSALLLPWPSLPQSYQNSGVQNAMKPILEVKDLLNKAMESLRSEGKLKSSLEVSAVITCDTAEGFDLLNTHRSILPVFWIVSAISIEVKHSEKDSSPLNPDCIASQRGEGVEVQVFQAEGEKCQRCLKFVSSVGSHPAHQTLCTPCIQAIEMLVS